MNTTRHSCWQGRTLASQRCAQQECTVPEHVHNVGLTFVVLQDCGGASGYEEFLEAISNPDDPEHNAMAVWCAAQANGT